MTTNDGSLTLGGGAVTEVDVDADLDVDGDIFTSGDVFVGGSSLGLQSQVDTNRQDIDRNTRGIAMVSLPSDLSRVRVTVSPSSNPDHTRGKPVAGLVSRIFPSDTAK